MGSTPDRIQEINQTLSSLLEGRDFRVVGRFPSRKNSVMLLDLGARRVVLKLFSEPFIENARKEYEILKAAHLKGLNVPEPYCLREKAVFMEYLDGENLCDLVNESPREEHATLIARWFSEFHHAFRNGDNFLLKSDSILRNFIYKGKLWAVDFEEACSGDPAQDIGEVCASILDTNPMFTPGKFSLSRRLIDSYEKFSGLKIKDRIDHLISVALLEAAGRRPEQREYLVEKAKAIDSEGLEGHIMGHGYRE